MAVREPVAVGLHILVALSRSRRCMELSITRISSTPERRIIPLNPNGPWHGHCNLLHVRCRTIELGEAVPFVAWLNCMGS